MRLQLTDLTRKPNMNLKQYNVVVILQGKSWTISGFDFRTKLDNQWVWLQDKCWTISGFDFRTNVGQSVGLMLCLIIIILLIGHLIFVDNTVVGKLCHFVFHLTKWSAHLNDSRDKMISTPQWFLQTFYILRLDEIVNLILCLKIFT
jgi:hypothetical protein